MSGGALSDLIDAHGFLSWLDLRLEAAGDGRVEMALPYDEKFANPIADADHMPVHGGVIASAIDTASAFALKTDFEDPVGARLATIDLDVSYLQPAVGDLAIEAEVVRAGGSVGVADVEVAGETPERDRDAVAIGRASYRLFR